VLEGTNPLSSKDGRYSAIWHLNNNTLSTDHIFVWTLETQTKIIMIRNHSIVSVQCPVPHDKRIQTLYTDDVAIPIVTYSISALQAVLTVLLRTMKYNNRVRIFERSCEFLSIVVFVGKMLKQFDPTTSVNIIFRADY